LVNFITIFFFATWIQINVSWSGSKTDQKIRIWIRIQNTAFLKRKNGQDHLRIFFGSVTSLWTTMSVCWSVCLSVQKVSKKCPKNVRKIISSYFNMLPLRGLLIIILYDIYGRWIDKYIYKYCPCLQPKKPNKGENSKQCVLLTRETREPD